MAQWLNDSMAQWLGAFECGQKANGSVVLAMVNTIECAQTTNDTERPPQSRFAPRDDPKLPHVTKNFASAISVGPGTQTGRSTSPTVLWSGQMAARHELPRSELESVLDQPETYQQLLGEYSGPVSLGLCVDENTGEPCFLLRVGNADVVRRRELDVDGHKIRVIVRPGYQAPVAG
jgi:hypothetical protein